MKQTCTTLKQTYKTLTVDLDDGIARVTFRRDKDTNAFCRDMTLDLMDVCRTVAEDDLSPEPCFTALVLTGGRGRSFSVGGDFNDVSVLEHEQEVRPWLGEIIDLYIAILSVNIPVVAAVDRFAIGQGLQVALMADWRIGTTECQLSMPELKNGVACPLGSVILEALLGRAKMLELLLDCEFIDAEAGRALALLNEITRPDDLQMAALRVAKKLALYPRTPYVTTKRIHNGRFIAALEEVREPGSKAHVASFEQHTGKSHFDRILKRA
jgi:enoyl-CoA hydratase/carnithine racemase